MDGGPARASLAEILEVERACCTRLAGLIDDERSAVAQRDLDALLGAVKERESIQALWQRTAAERRAWLADEGATPDPEVAPLVQALHDAARDLARAQRVNAAIVRGALRQVGDLLAVLRREQPGSRYDGNAALTAPLPQPAGAGWRA
jgi:flagellar biosynthesis/type III secretory pathway chaperone